MHSSRRIVKETAIAEESSTDGGGDCLTIQAVNHADILGIVSKPQVHVFTDGEKGV